MIKHLFCRQIATLHPKNLIILDFRNATFDRIENSEGMFSSVPSDINITTKNTTTKAWLEDKLGGKGTVTIG